MVPAACASAKDVRYHSQLLSSSVAHVPAARICSSCRPSCPSGWKQLGVQQVRLRLVALQASHAGPLAVAVPAA
eukprot:jgi/Chrpa1/15347/Chrysochromulina_OHIO_Genome00000348-RA